MSVLELNHVKKSFNNGTLHVLKDISLSVEKGEVVAIIGPSGSGKSTLLRCATLLERIDSGEVCFDGHYAARTGDDGAAVYADKAELKQIRNYFGLVFQQFNLFPHYSVLKNVMDAPICVQQRDRAARKTFGGAERRRARQLEYEVRAAPDRRFCAGVLVEHGEVAALHEISAHHADDDGVSAETFARAADVKHMAAVKRIVFRNDPDRFHINPSFFTLAF